MLIDNHYRQRLAMCMSRKRMKVWLIGQQNTVFVTLMGLTKQLILKDNEGSFWMVLMDLLCLPVAQIPRSRDLAIFVPTTTDDRQSPL